MPSENRNVTWRQGDIFTIPAKEGLLALLGVIASHDCDICAEDDVEPIVEILQVRIVDTEEGSLTLGKNPRRLHATIYIDGTNAINVELDIRTRDLLAKREFLSEAEKYSHQLDRGSVRVFQRWLAGRYGRSAFPNAFEGWMRGKVQEKIDRLSDKRGHGIRALYFDLDENQMIERSESDDPYELAIYVVYPGSTDDDEAKAFAHALSEIFKNAFFDKAKEIWARIHLLSCDQFPEDVFPLALANSAKSWRVDHRSYGGSPASSVQPEPDR